MIPVIGRTYKIECGKSDYEGLAKCLRKIGKRSEGYSHVTVDIWEFSLFGHSYQDYGIFDEEDIVGLAPLALEVGKIYTDKNGQQFKLVYADLKENKLILDPVSGSWEGTVEEFNENFS